MKKSRHPPGQTGAPLPGVDRGIRLAAGAAALLLCGPAIAQDSNALRGAVNEQSVTRDLLSGPSLAERRSPLSSRRDEDRSAGIPVPGYRPDSDGALSDEELSRSLGIEADGDGLAARSGAGASRVQSTQAFETDPDDPVDDETSADPTTTATVPAATVDSLDERRNRRADSENTRAQAIGATESDEEEEDPYAPLGIRVGTFILRTTLDQGIEYSSNSDSSPGGQSAVFSETTLRVDAESDWSRHSANVSAFGTFRKTISGEEFTDPEAGIEADVVLDLAQNWQILGGAGYSVARESATAPVDFSGTVNRPLAHQINGSVGVEKTAGQILLRLTGEADRLFYNDAELSTGGTASQSDRNQTLATVALRAGYEVAPAVTPFVEVEVGRRIYDEDIDRNGFARSSKRIGARAGVEVDLEDKLVGEVSAGWVREDIDDSRLASVSGLTVDGNLIWSPSRRTEVTLNGSTTVEGSTTGGSSGSVLYNGTAGIAYDIMANLTGTATFGAAWRDFSGSNTYNLTLSGEVGFVYWLNRSLGVVGRARHETVKSNIASDESKTNSAYLGLRWQR